MKRFAVTEIAAALAAICTSTVFAQYELEQVVQVTEPLAVYQSPISSDTRLFIVRQSGQISIYDGGTLLATPFLNISSLVSTGGEQGLLDMTFHPLYETNGHIFVNYTNTSGNTVVRRYTVSGSDSNLIDTTTATDFLTQSQDFSNHNGGQLEFGPDGYLYIAFGDGGSGNDPNCRAQETDTFLGKMLRIDVDSGSPYSVPATNPFVGPGGHLDEVWAYGLRNPWRFSFDKTTNDLWIADVGQGTKEEVNRQLAASTGGQNYGWKMMEGTFCLNSTSGCSGVTVPACNDAAYTPPQFDYNRSSPNCAVTGGFVYRGSAIPALVGKYIYGDYCAGDVRAYDPTNGNDVLLVSGSNGLTSFGQDRAGEIYVSYQPFGSGAPPHTVYKLISNAKVHDWRVQ